MSRSSRAEVRNPLLAMPEVVEAFCALPPEAREATRRALLGMSRNWHSRAEEAWRKRKGPMAAYHRANAVNARHLAFAIRSIPDQGELL